MNQLNALIKCTNYMHQLNALIKCTNYITNEIHWLNALIKCKWSTTVESEWSVIHWATHHWENNSGYSIQYIYGTRDLEKKLNWHSVSIEKKIYSRFRLPYCYYEWDLKKSISLDHHWKKKYFRFQLHSATVMHRA